MRHKFEAQKVTEKHTIYITDNTMDRIRPQSLQDIQRMNLHTSSTHRLSAKLSSLNLDNHRHRRKKNSQDFKQSLYRTSQHQVHSKGIYDYDQVNHHPSSSTGMRERSGLTQPIKFETQKRFPRGKRLINQNVTNNKNVHDTSDGIAISHDENNQPHPDTLHFDLCLPDPQENRTPISDISTDNLDWMEDLYTDPINHFEGKVITKGKKFSIHQLGGANNISAVMDYVLESTSRHRSCFSPQIKRFSRVINRSDREESFIPRKSPEISYLHRSVSDFLVTPEWQRHEQLLLDWRAFVNGHMIRSPKIASSSHEPQSAHSIAQAGTFCHIRENISKESVPHAVKSDPKSSQTKKRRNKKKSNKKVSPKEK
jgi:hypothetical protein